jgi:hypothetical protein
MSTNDHVKINSTVPVLMAEFAPKATRGIYVCAQLSTLNFGIMLVYWIDYGFGVIPGSASFAWRVPTILQCIFLYGDPSPHKHCF